MFERNLPAGINSFDENDEVSKRILKDYGAIFVAQNNVITPPKIIFKDEEDCLSWQSKVSSKRENFGGIEIELQMAAMNDLIAVPAAQIAEILRFESKGMFFSKDFSKSVLYSATPPGASQHLSMLAVDINENSNSNVRSILAKHGWFQTVASDVPHFTYLGVSEDKLTALGLKKLVKDNRIYWIPDM